LQQNNASQLSLNDVYQPEYVANPYKLYHRLRETDPVFWDEQLGGWVLTSYNDVVAMLRDSRFSAQRFVTDNEWMPTDMVEALGSPMRALTRQMIFLDPPDHTRLRGLVSKAFTPRVIEGLREHIQQIVDDLLDKALPQGHINLIQEFTYPLPAIVIAEMLGVPPEDRELFFKWTNDFGTILDGGELTQEQLVQAFMGVSEFMDYFRQIIAQRRTQPQDDVIQALITAEEGGSMLSEEELLGNCILLLAAGHGTTTHLLGNGMLALLRNPDQYQLLKERPDLLQLAVMELLRYDGPVQVTSRKAKEALVIRDKKIETGQNVYAVLGAASHDPAQFADPDRLDIQRVENRHLAFGQGIHYCLGAPLARLEAEIALSALTRRLLNPRIENEAEVEFFPAMVFRGLNELPLVLGS
jgi:cytochrome P450